MRSLSRVQTLFKVCKIISLIVFILSIIGAVGCLIGLITLPMTQDVIINDGLTVTEYLEREGISLAGAYAAMVSGLTFCGVNIFISKYAEILFKRELALGTPFDRDFSKSIRKLGITQIIVVIACGIISAIVQGVIFVALSVKGKVDFSSAGSIVFGIVLLLLSLFLDYGADLVEQNKKPVENENPVPDIDK